MDRGEGARRQLLRAREPILQREGGRRGGEARPRGGAHEPVSCSLLRPEQWWWHYHFAARRGVLLHGRHAEEAGSVAAQDHAPLDVAQVPTAPHEGADVLLAQREGVVAAEHHL